MLICKMYLINQDSKIGTNVQLLQSLYKLSRSRISLLKDYDVIRGWLQM